MAIVDANYKFIAVDVGAYGSASDGGIFGYSSMGKKILNGNFNIPAPEELKDHPNLGKFPYVFVADEAFPLHDNIMRPYPGQADRLPLNESSFNYRLSTAHKMSECAF